MRSAIRLRLFCAVALLFVLSSMLMLSVSASSDQEATLSTISEAEQSMAQAYEAVLDAERAGAEISGLLARLNDAAGMISEGHMAFEVGDFEEATRFAELSGEVAWEVVGKAEWLEVEAKNEHANRKKWFMAGSATGITIVSIASLLGYEYFKGRYYKRLSKRKPRVGLS